jgi:hypothetical protein
MVLFSRWTDGARAERGNITSAATNLSLKFPMRTLRDLA